MENFIIEYSPDAIADIEEIGSYIAEVLNNLLAANTTVNKIIHEINRLKTSPEIGSILELPTYRKKGLRLLVCGHYLVIYRVEGRCVKIIRVVFGKRDYARLLED